MKSPHINEHSFKAGTERYAQIAAASSAARTAKRVARVNLLQGRSHPGDAIVDHALRRMTVLKFLNTAISNHGANLDTRVRKGREHRSGRAIRMLRNAQLMGHEQLGNLRPKQIESIVSALDADHCCTYNLRREAGSGYAHS